MTRIVFLDLETTGLTPGLHEPWEFGLIVRDEGVEDLSYLWRVHPDLSLADPLALQKNRFYTVTGNMRTPGDGNVQTGHLCDLAADFCPQLQHLTGIDRYHHWSPAIRVADAVAHLIDSAVVVGANPAFDRDFLRPFLNEHGHAHTAHYRPVCVTAMGAGCLHGRGDPLAAVRLPWGSDDISALLGVDPDAYDRHTALGDASWVRAQWDAITGPKGGER